ncbi:MAG: ABC transporter ATP-binding protein [Acutalibacteraceae bacterium]
MPIILNNICKSFGEKKVLENFSLEVNEGERICLLGSSGGGKTTLLNIISGVIAPDSGNLQCNCGKISYIFQEYRLLPWVDAAENITAASGCTNELAEELLNAMELSGDMHSYPDSLSGGMKQRVNIARALAAGADTILMDEPFKGLDPALKARIIAVVDRYCSGRTVILVTHDRCEAELLNCTRIYEFE